MLGGCSLANFDLKLCQSTRECEEDDNFGEGYICNSEGYCESGDVTNTCNSTDDCLKRIGFGSSCDDGRCVDIVPTERCTKTVPPFIFDNLDAHRERTIFGVVNWPVDADSAANEKGVTLATENINDQTDVSIGIVICDITGTDDVSTPFSDNRTSSEAAEFVAGWLVNSLGVPGISASRSSGQTQSIFQRVIDRARPAAVQISPSGTSPTLTDLEPPASDENPGLLWRTAVSAAGQAAALVADMASRDDPRITSLAVVHEADAFGTGVANAVIAAWSALGDRQQEQFIYANATEQGEKTAALANRVDNGDFEAAVFIGQTAASAAFFRALTAEPKFPDTFHIYMADSGATDTIFNEANSDQKLADKRFFEQMRAVRPSIAAGATFDTFAALYRTRFNEAPETFTPNSYDTIYMLTLGVEWARANEGEVNGVTIARGFRKTAGGSVRVPFQPSQLPNGIAQFRQGQAIDVQGTSGELDWDPVTEEASGFTDLLVGTPEGVYAVLKSRLP